MSKLFGLIQVVGLALLLVACSGKTTGANVTGPLTATLNATGSCSGGSPNPCHWQFRYAPHGTTNWIYTPVQGPCPASGSTNPCNATDAPVSADVSSLTPNTAYDYQVGGWGDQYSQAQEGWVGTDGTANTVSSFTTPVAQQGTGCTTAEQTAVRQPACWLPFASGSSPWNRLLPANPALDPNNAAFQQHVARTPWAFEQSSGYSIDGGGSRPVYFATSADPLFTVNCTHLYGATSCQGTDGVNTSGIQIHAPAHLLPSANGDAHLTVVETDTGDYYDFSKASVSGQTIKAGVGSHSNVNTGNGTGLHADASNTALLAGLLRPQELLSGHIDHALQLDAPCTAKSYAYPATASNGEYCGQHWSETLTGAPPLGGMMKLNMTDAEIAGSGAPAWEQTVMTALAHYGGIFVDTNGTTRDDAIHIFQQDPRSWTSVGAPDQWQQVISQLGGASGTLSSSVPIPANRLELLAACVAQGTC
ncbi:MAG: hypothetical protein M3071_15850 [Actinomycetota bacterium]|nr:hypothetical protein [Actinomycetota bacterium]